MAPDTLSFLSHSNLPLAKTWKTDGSIQDYSKPKHFKLSQFTFTNIKDLSAFFSKIENQHNTCLIRGKYTGHTPNLTTRRKEVFSDQPLHMLLVEIDNFKREGFNPNEAPVEIILYYIEKCLPECFHNISFHWQLSNSAGHPSKAGILKAHVYFWLRTSYTSAQLRAWAKNNNLTDVLDVATLDEVQVHYTSLPVFEDGVIDPVPMRSGFVEGLVSDEVDLVLDAASLAAEARKRPTGSIYDGDDSIALWLEEHNIAKSLGDNGKIFIDCPFADGHTGGKTSDTDTTYLPANSGGFEQGHFKCLHGSCSGRDDADFLDAFGIRAADFEVIPDDAPELQDVSQELNRFAPIHASDFAGLSEPEWIIEDILPQAEFGIIFGATGSRKTFVALDMAFAIATGREWNGKQTQPGKVLYICAEGASDFRIRLKAYARQFNVDLKDVPLYVIGNTPNLLVKEDIQILLKQIEPLGSFATVIIDTLAQTTAGGDENSGKDMTRALSHCKTLHKKTGGIVMIIHHAGKDLTKGARGWSGLKAAADVEFEVIDNGNGTSTLCVSKQKGGEAGLAWTVRTPPVVVGSNKRGKDITSLYVEYSEKSAPNVNYKIKKRSFWQQTVLNAFDSFGGGAELVMTVTEEAIRASASTDAPRKKRYKARRALEELAVEGEISIKDGVISRPL